MASRSFSEFDYDPVIHVDGWALMQFLERTLLSLVFVAVAAFIAYIGTDYKLLVHLPYRPEHVRRRAARVMAIGCASFCTAVVITPLLKAWEIVGGFLSLIIALTTLGIFLLTLARDD